MAKRKPKRKHLKVKMKNSLHGQAIAIPRNVKPETAAAILRQELQADTPVDTGKAISGWRPQKLANGDMRVKNDVPYIRKLMIDGTSPQARAGAHNDSIRKARNRILQEGISASPEIVSKIETKPKPEPSPEFVKISGGDIALKRF